MTALYVLAGGFILVLFQALRRPMLRRLAIRDAARRPGETALVIAGSLLGTALITGSFIVGDTLDSSIKATAYTQLGPVDEVVQAPDEEVGRELLGNIEAANDERIDGVTSVVIAEGSLVSDASEERLAEPNGQVIELDFEEGRRFGGDPEIGGISGDTPRAGEVVITEDLAEEIQAEAGDEVVSYMYGRRLTFTVDRVVPTVGLAGLWFGFESKSPNAFVAPGTLDPFMAEELAPGVAPPNNWVLVSNRGDVESGVSLTDEVSATIEEAFPEDSTLRIWTAKQDSLETADEQGKQFSELFIGIGSFAIIAGILLLVNIFVMLAEERKSQLGMLRAVGMRRGFLVRAFVIEGAIYSLTSAVLGAFLGIGVGWAIVKLAAPIFSAFGDFSLDLIFDFEFSSIILGFASGGLICLVTVFLTSLRISRINVIRAIRELPEPPRGNARTVTVVTGIVISVLAIAGFIATFANPDAWLIAMLGPPVALLGLLPTMSRRFNRRTAVLIVAAVSLLWGIFGNLVTSSSFFESGEIFAFVVQGVLLTFSAVMLLTQVQETLEGAIRRVAARRLPLRLSVAYPLARRFRTGLTLGMFALVIFTMTFIAVLSNVFGGQVAETASKEGDFEILMTSNVSNPPDTDEIGEVEGVESISTLLTGIALFQPEGVDEPEPWTVSAFDESFIDGGPPNLTEFSTDFETEKEVWRAVLDDPSTTVVPEFLLQEGGGPTARLVGPDESLIFVDPLSGDRVERRILGLVENDFAFSGAYLSKESIRKVIGNRAAAARFYVETTEDPEEATAIARRIEGAFVENGVEATTFRDTIEEFAQVNLQFLRLMQGYLALGLMVGIAGLGVVMVRAVRERRREVGVLRSLGFLVKQVRRAFVLESTFVAFEGIVIGAGLALVTASQLVATGEFGENLDFQVPWGNVLVLTVGSLIASVLATAWPAQQASKIPPAAALRIAD